MSSARGLSLLKSIENYAKSSSNYFDQTRVFSKVKLTESKDGCLRGTFTVDPSMCNSFEALHGGYIAALMDTVCIFSPLELPDGRLCWTSSLNVNFMRPALAGERILFETTPLKHSNFSVVEATLRKEKTGKIVAKGTVSMLAGPEDIQKYFKKITGFDVYEK